MTTLSDMNITLSVTKPEPEARFLVLPEPVEWNEAVRMAIQCRETHPKEPIELIPRGDLWFVVRCEARE